MFAEVDDALGVCAGDLVQRLRPPGRSAVPFCVPQVLELQVVQHETAVIFTIAGASQRKLPLRRGPIAQRCVHASESGGASSCVVFRAAPIHLAPSGSSRNGTLHNLSACGQSFMC